MDNLAKSLIIATLVALGAVFLSCESLWNGSEDKDTGTLSVLLIDTPFPADLIAEANITIDSLIVHAMDSDTFITLSSDRQVFNLLDLRNGFTADLASLEIPTGRYNQVRLVVNDSAASVILNNGTSAALEIPSGGKSGMKLNIKPFLQIEASIESELLLDFDVSRSFKAPSSGQGDTLRFIFSPALRVVNLANAGRVQGTVTDVSETPILNAQLSISNQDSVISTTFTDTAGAYAFIGIPVGTYTVEAAAAGYNTETASDVAVDAKGTTVQNFVLTLQ